jgi:hypothetical protein
MLLNKKLLIDNSALPSKFKKYQPDYIFIDYDYCTFRERFKINFWTPYYPELLTIVNIGGTLRSHLQDIKSKRKSKLTPV